MPTREFHIVGGLDMKAGLELLHRHAPRAQGAPSAGAHQGAHRGRDRAHRADREGDRARRAARAARGGARHSLPGGGAEVFSTAVRATIAERKLTGEEWIRVHRTAHELGIPTNCTMLYGHVETAEDRIEHLVDAPRAAGRDRRLPRLHPAGLPSGPQRAGRRAAVGWAPRRRATRISRTSPSARLFLDNVPHIKTHWMMVTPFLSQIALSFGVQRRRGHGGVREGVSRGRRAHPDAHALPRAGPAHSRRGQAAGRARQPLSARARPVRRSAARAVAPAGRRAAGGARRMRLGRIPWINCYPVYGAIDRGLVRVPAELVTGTASELNDLLAAGRAAGERRLGGGVRAERGGAISCCPTSRSPATGRCTASRCSRAARSTSSTAARCCGPRRRARRCCCSISSPATAGACGPGTPRRAPRPRISTRCPACRTRRCSSSATRRSCSPREERYPVRVDLGAEWKAWTGLPFVFAVWAARRDAGLDAVQAVHRRLLESRAWGLAHLDAPRRGRGAQHWRPGVRVSRVSRRSGLRAVLPPPRRAHRFLPSAGPGGAGAGRIAVLHLGRLAAPLPGLGRSRVSITLQPS